MKRYDYSFNFDPNGFGYATIEYHFFELREVLKDGESTGEYHVKLLDASPPECAIDALKIELPGCKIGLVDPSKSLKLEYPIYIIVENPMVKSNFNEIISNLDSKICREAGVSEENAC